MPTLKLKIVKATNLKNTDTFSKTDAFVLVKWEGKEARTKIIKDNLNPVWNEELTLNITNPKTCVLQFLMFDEDTATNNDLFGAVPLPVYYLAQGVAMKFELRLTPLDSGHLLFVEATAVDFSASPGGSGSQDDARLKQELQDLIAKHQRKSG